MNKMKAFATLLLSALGVFGANEYYKPRNIKDLLKWRGIKLASGNRVWKSMFFENQEELKSMGIDNENSLWTWCQEKFKATNIRDDQTFSDVKKYCSDSATSILGRIIREGEDVKLIKKNDSDGFKLNYFLSENQQEVLKLIGFVGEAKSKLQEVGEKLSQWCEEQKKVKIISSEDLNKFGNFKKRCYDRGVKTVSQLLAKQRRRTIKEDEYKRRFKGHLEYAPDLKEAIKPFLEQKKDLLTKSSHYMQWKRKNIDRGDLEEEKYLLQEEGWRLYKWWCESNLDNSLLNAGVYPTTYEKVFSRCTEEIKD